MQPPKTSEEKIHYHMECVINDGDNKTRKIDRILEKSDMEKFIGRYTMHYGPPLDYSSGKENILQKKYQENAKTGDIAYYQKNITEIVQK